MGVNVREENEIQEEFSINRENATLLKFQIPSNIHKHGSRIITMPIKLAESRQFFTIFKMSWTSVVKEATDNTQ